MQFQPHDYQREAIDFLVRRLYLEGQAGAGLFMDCGLGKTAITLSAIQALRDVGEVRRTLIVAPLRTIYSVWPQEIAKWEFNLTWTRYHGAKRRQALEGDADILLVNPEGLAALWRLLPDNAFDLLVVDESTKFKNAMAKRTQTLFCMLPQVRKRICLTGTPSPRCLSDLFAQAFILDDGQALGKSIWTFRQTYMCRGGFEGKEWILRRDAPPRINRAIEHLVLRLAADDHLDLPPIVHNDVWVDLPAKAAAAYRAVEDELFDEIDDGLANAASSASYLTCRGVANGGYYHRDEDGKRHTVHVHDAKVEAVCDVVDELFGKPVLVAYQFHHDLERLQRKFPRAPVICGGTPAAKADDIVQAWNRGQLPVLLVQPQSLSHGVNLQAGGNDAIWFGLPDQLEVYLQFNARLHRQGVQGQVRIHHVLARGTVDAAVRANLQRKSRQQDGLLTALRQYRTEKTLRVKGSVNG